MADPTPLRGRSAFFPVATVIALAGPLLSWHVQAAQDLGLYSMQNASTRFCLAIPDDLQGNAAPAQVRNCTHEATERVMKPRRWKLVDTGDGKLSIRHAEAAVCLNLKTSEDDREGGSVKVVGCSGHPDQLWEADYRVSPQSNMVSLRNMGSGKCLNVHRGRDNRDGGRVTVYTCADTPDQLWSLVPMAFEKAHYGDGVAPVTLNHPALPGDTRYAVFKDGSRYVADGDMIMANDVRGRRTIAAPPPRQYSGFRLTRPTPPDCNGAVCPNQSELSVPENVSLWPGGVVPFNTGCSNGRGTVPTVTELGRIRQATDFLTRQTVLTFRPAVGREDQITFCKITTNAGGLSAVGRQGGTQAISLSNAGNARLATIYHELMHAIGFVHEHQRADRDNFLRVDLGNVQAQWRYAFELRENLVDVTPYDIGSIMHYRGSISSFAIDATRPVITDRAGNILPVTNRPSRYDIDGINILYNPIAGSGSWPDLTAHRLLTLIVNNVQSDDRDGGAKREIDFYAKVEMGGGLGWRPGGGRNPTERFKSSTLEDYDNHMNPNWSFTTPIQVGERFARIVFQLRDDDGASRWERTDEDVDIHPLPGIKHLEYIVDTQTRDVFLAGIDGQYTAADLVGNGPGMITIQRGTEGPVRGETTVSILVTTP